MKNKGLLIFFWIIVCLFYVIPGIISLFFFKEDYLFYTLELLLIIIMSVICFTVGFVAVKTRLAETRRVHLKNLIKLLKFLFVIYLIIVIKVFSDTPPALFELFSGDYQKINELRAYATKNKSGIDSLINGFYFTFSYIILPALLVYSYYVKNKYRNYVFLIFTFILMLNMQKARIIYLIIPIASLYIGSVSKIKLLKFSSLLFGFLILMSNLSGFNSSNHSIILANDLFIRSTSGFRMLFSDFNSINFVINRIFWIPYITAVDWMSYFHNILNEQVYGSTIPLFYKVFGHSERLLIENEVFKYSFNSGSGSLGTANSHFAIDAYMNFGFFGVIFYSLIAGGLISFLSQSIPKPINFIMYNYIYALCFSSLHANFMGGGLWLLLIIVLYIKLIKGK